MSWKDILKAAPRRSTRGTSSRVSGRRQSTPIRRGRKKKKRSRDEKTQDSGESAPLAAFDRFRTLPYEKKLGLDDARKGNWAEVEKIRQKYNEGTNEIIQRVASDRITSPIKEPWLSVIDRDLNLFRFGSGGWEDYKRKGFDRNRYATSEDKKNMELLIAITENLKGLDSDLYKPKNKSKSKMSRPLQYKRLKVPPSDETRRGDEIHRLRSENTVLLGIHHRFNALMNKAGGIEHSNGEDRSVWSIRAKPLSMDEFEGRPAGKIGSHDVISYPLDRFRSTVPRGLVEDIYNVYRTYYNNKDKLEQFLNSPQNEMGIKLEELIIPE